MGDAITAGDVIGLTEKALKDKELRQLSPRRLHKIGWPNRFVVVDVFKDGEEGDCVSILPCCGFLCKKSGIPYCGGHPQRLFEKLESKKEQVEEPSEEAKGEASSTEGPPVQGQNRHASIKVPGLGTVASLEFRDDPKHASLKGEFLGLEHELTGSAARIAKTLIQEFGGIF